MLRKQAEVLKVRQPTAFAVPGQFVYIVQALVQRLNSDDSVAFVIAHEIAHLDLGHLDLFQQLAMWCHVPGGELFALLMCALQGGG